MFLAVYNRKLNKSALNGKELIFPYRSSGDRAISRLVNLRAQQCHQRLFPWKMWPLSMFSCSHPQCVGFRPPAFLIMVPRWLPHLQASFPHTAMLRYQKGAVFPHNGRKTFPRSCRRKVSFELCLLELCYTSIPEESMLRKMEFPQ